MLVLFLLRLLPQSGLYDSLIYRVIGAFGQKIDNSLSFDGRVRLEDNIELVQLKRVTNKRGNNCNNVSLETQVEFFC